MSVSNTVSKIVYSANTVQLQFAYPFKIFENTDLVVTKHRASDASENILALTTDYTVSGVGAEAGGVVTIVSGAPSTGYNLIIERELPITQPVVYTENDPFPAKTHEYALDRLTYICQQLAELTGRAVVLDPTQIMSAIMPPPLASNLIGWNGAATALMNYPNTGAASAAQASASAIQASNSATAALAYSLQASAWAGTASSGSAVKGFFTSTNVTAGIFTIAHALGLSSPYSLMINVYNPLGNMVFVDGVQGSANASYIDLTSYIPILSASPLGTWGYAYI